MAGAAQVRAKLEAARAAEVMHQAQARMRDKALAGATPAANAAATSGAAGA